MDKQKKSLFLALVSSNYLLESNNSSSSDFSSEEEQSRDIFLTAFTYISPEWNPRYVGYLNLISQYSNLEFWKHFRVSRATFSMLLDILSENNFRSNVV